VPARTTRTRLVRTLSVVWATLALSCPPYPGGTDYESSFADIPANAQSANIELVAVVPQGDWVLRFTVAGSWSVESAEPSAQLDEPDPTCITASCREREYQLHCARGKCSFTFQIAAERDAQGTLGVVAGIVFDRDPGDHGCGSRPNPHYVESEDRELFELSFSVSDVVFVALSAPPTLGLDAQVLDAAPSDARALETGAAEDVIEVDGSSEDAGAPLEPVRVIRGDSAQQSWWDLSVRGAALQAFEGMIATVRIGDPGAPPERLGSGQARIEAGAFALTFPAVWEATLYKHKRAFIDTDGNGHCDAQLDAVFADQRGARVDSLTLQQGGTNSPEFFPTSSEPAADCAALNVVWPQE
jgi:hypothetical protein